MSKRMKTVEMLAAEVGTYDGITKKRPRKMTDLQSGIGIGRPSVID